ncbi:hypothetical protein [Nonomuraea sp. NPDC049400]|uniref:hypothetical protein n=1 Tax=Nonomuraea sp. NPDC049400 TaxID=3364352 RepID=UPI0037B121EA
MAALIGACHRFATHVDLLADRLGAVDLSADDAERVNDAIMRAFTVTALASSLTVGLQREANEAECPHFNVLTDAEWARLSADEMAAHDRNATYLCALQPGHPGPHVSLAQSFGERDVWLRWAVGVRELGDLAPCPSSAGPADDPELCHLFDGHPGEHAFDPGAPAFSREASPEMLRRMDDLLAE